MAASKLAFNTPLNIDQGGTFNKLVTWKVSGVVVDLTGATARAQFREAVDSPAVLLSLTTENNRIALGGALGTVTITLTDEETAAITWEEAVYDLEIVFANGTVRRLMYGKVTVSPEVTRVP